MVVKLGARIATPDDLARDPELKNFELVYGQLVEKDVSKRSSYTAGELHRQASNHSKPRRLGWCFPDNTSIQCYAEDPSRVRKPDFLFIALSRMPVAEVNDEGHITIVPDCVAEVISPNDSSYDVETKLEEYLRAGVKLVWLIWPHTQTVRVHRQDGSEIRLQGDAELDGENVIPGFKLKLADLFAMP